jgi:hypothetical protein
MKLRGMGHHCITPIEAGREGRVMSVRNDMVMMAYRSRERLQLVR